jgi:hypothetical protein
MNWGIFAIVAWLLLGVELGLRSALQIGHTPMAPSFLLPLAVWIALWAPQATASTACLIVGLLLDLTSPLPLVDSGVEVVAVGPYALGCLLMAQAIIAARGLMIKKNPLTLMVLTVVGGMVAHAVVAALYTARWSIGDPIVWEPTQQLVARAGIAAYSSLSALAVSLLLYPIQPLFAFASSSPTRGFIRRDE